MNTRAVQEFWDMADTSRMEAEYKVDRNLQYLESAPLHVLRKIFVQYRFFTIFYITDLAVLVSKLPFGSLRSCLAHFLAEELGEGNPAHAHPQLYDDFLLSVGVTTGAIDRPEAGCQAPLEQVSQSLINRSWAYGVGLRGMGGECLCQVYLSSMYEHFSRNPAIKALQGQIAWKFWDIHIGDVDIHHREMTRAAVNELVIKQPEALVDLAAGYRESKDAWDRFWKTIYRAATAVGSAPRISENLPAIGF